MRQDKFSGQRIFLYCLGAIPVVWLALLIAPAMGGGIPSLLQNIGTVFNDPFHIKWGEYSLKTVLALLGVYGLAIMVYLSTDRNYRKREEHGSAKWGNPAQLFKKYAARKKTDNKILTQRVAIGLDGRKHKRNLNVLVCGGSGAGKTRFYAKPNIMNANSIDEVFIDATSYLKTYKISAQQLAMRMIREVLYTTGITATAGIGTNLFLAKIAMDIVAKHMEPDENGVRMAELDEMSFRRILWGHKPLTDFWRIGPGIARKLEQNGMFTLGDVAKMSVTKHPVVVHIEKPKKNENAVQTMKNGEDLLYKLFGINAELIIDHAWGWEPCTVDVIKQYRPENNSLGSGQVLHEPYTFDKARIIVMEMADELSMSLVRKGLATERIELYIGFDRESLTEDHGLYRYKDGRVYKGAVTADPYGRPHPKHANGNYKLDFPTSSTKLIVDAAVSIFEQKVDKGLLVRRVGVTACNVIPKQEAERIRRERQEVPEQLSMFTDYDSLAAEKEAQEKKLEREKRLQEAMLTIKDKFGKNAVLKGLNYQEGARGRERNNEVGGHKA